MPLIDPHAKTSWVALFCLVLVGAVGAVVFEQLVLAAVLAAVACAGLVVTAAVGAVRFVAAHAGRMRRFPLPTATLPALAADGVAPHAAASALGCCPRCAARLSEALGAYDERRCPARHGVLLALTGSERLFEHAKLDAEIVRAVVREQGTKRGVCPACGAAMHEARLRGVVVDLCLSCGALWLDDLELAKLTNARAFAAP